MTFPLAQFTLHNDALLTIGEKYQSELKTNKFLGFEQTFLLSMPLSLKEGDEHIINDQGTLKLQLSWADHSSELQSYDIRLGFMLAATETRPWVFDPYYIIYAEIGDDEPAIMMSMIGRNGLHGVDDIAPNTDLTHQAIVNEVQSIVSIQGIDTFLTRTFELFLRQRSNWMHKGQILDFTYESFGDLTHSGEMEVVRSFHLPEMMSLAKEDFSALPSSYRNKETAFNQDHLIEYLLKHQLLAGNQRVRTIEIDRHLFQSFQCKDSEI